MGCCYLFQIAAYKPEGERAGAEWKDEKKSGIFLIVMIIMFMIMMTLMMMIAIISVIVTVDDGGRC